MASEEEAGKMASSLPNMVQQHHYLGVISATEVPLKPLGEPWLVKNKSLTVPWPEVEAVACNRTTAGRETGNVISRGSGFRSLSLRLLGQDRHLLHR